MTPPSVKRTYTHLAQRRQYGTSQRSPPVGPVGQPLNLVGVGWTGAPSLRVIVADDDASVRQRVRRALSATPGLEVTAMARDGAEAWRCALELSPDVLVLDDVMPIVDGLGVLERLRTEAPDIQIVMYVETPATCIVAAELGAAGCVSKGAPLDTLLAAIRVLRLPI